MNNKKTHPTSIRLKDIHLKMLDKLCDKYSKNKSEMLIYLLEKEFYKESDSRE